MVDEITRASLLYDFYGALLTEKQRQVMALYHEENLSLSEIGQEFGISRQAVHDTQKKAEQALEEYEEKLGLIDKFLRTEQAIAAIEEEIDRMEKLTSAATDSEAAHEAAQRLARVKEIIAALDE